MKRIHQAFVAIALSFSLLMISNQAQGQDLPLKYATLELFTNTPCLICGSQNPALFDRLENYEGKYHLVSFYPGVPYASCIFFKANMTENQARKTYYPDVFGTPTVAINGTQFKSSNGVTNTVLNAVTGGETWLEVHVEETPGSNRTVDITLDDHVGGSVTTGRLFAVIVEREIQYSAPNGENLHHNVFRKFLTNVNGEDVDMSSGTAVKNYSYTLDPNWQADQVYVIAWLTNPGTKEIYNSGTRFDPDFISATRDIDTKFVEIKAYPNPTQDKFFVELPELLNQSVNVKILSPSGQVVKNIHNQHITTAPLELEVRDLTSGVYYILVEGKNKSYRSRVVVE